MINTSSNLGEYREAINNLENNYLPKSGGTMTGNIAVNQMYANRPNSSTTWGIGVTWNDAPSISLYGPNAESGVVNGFQIRAGANACSLTGKSDGTLTWKGNNIIIDGGTISKSLTSSSSVLAKKATDDKSIIIYSGTDASKGATFGGYGIDYETYGGRFYAKATDGTNEYFFYCRPDGKMTWCGNEIRFVKTTYTSGTSWYRIWSDGWIEQGGYNSAGGTITYLKAFSNTNYTLVGGLIPGTPSTTYEHLNMASQTTTGFSYTRYDNYNLKWYACGY